MSRSFSIHACLLAGVCSLALLSASDSHAQKRRLVTELPSVEVNLEVIRALRQPVYVPPVYAQAPIVHAVPVQPRNPFSVGASPVVKAQPPIPVPIARNVRVVPKENIASLPVAPARRNIPEIQIAKVAEMDDRRVNTARQVPPVAPRYAIPPLPQRNVPAEPARYRASDIVPPPPPVIAKAARAPAPVLPVLPRTETVRTPTASQPEQLLGRLFDNNAQQSTKIIAPVEKAPAVAVASTQDTAEDVLHTLMGMPKAKREELDEDWVPVPSASEDVIDEMRVASAPPVTRTPRTSITSVPVERKVVTKTPVKPDSVTDKLKPVQVPAPVYVPEAKESAEIFEGLLQEKENDLDLLELPELTRPEAPKTTEEKIDTALDEAVDAVLPNLPQEPAAQPVVPPLPDLPPVQAINNNAPVVDLPDVPPLPDLPDLPPPTNVASVVNTPPLPDVPPVEAAPPPVAPNLPELSALTGNTPAATAPVPRVIDVPPLDTPQIDLPELPDAPQPLPNDLPALNALTEKPLPVAPVLQQSPVEIARAEPVAPAAPAPIAFDPLPDLPELPALGGAPAPAVTVPTAEINAIPPIPAPNNAPAVPIIPEQEIASLPPEPITAPTPENAAAAGVAEMKILFTGDAREVPASDEDALKRLASTLKDSRSEIIVIGYGSGSPDQRSQARRIALARALAVRAILIENGVVQRRISSQFVQAGASDGNPNKVEVFVK